MIESQVAQICSAIAAVKDELHIIFWMIVWAVLIGANLRGNKAMRKDNPMTETEQAIDRIHQDGPPWDGEDVRALLAEYDLIKAELDRLTTLRPASEHSDGECVLWWKRSLDGYWQPVQLCYYCPSTVCVGWTPLPTPKEAPCDESNQNT